MQNEFVQLAIAMNLDWLVDRSLKVDRHTSDQFAHDAAQGATCLVDHLVVIEGLLEKRGLVKRVAVIVSEHDR